MIAARSWFLLTFAFVLSAVVASSAEEKPKNALPKEMQAVLDQATELELYSLHPDERERVKDGFHGWKVLGKTVIKDGDKRKAILAAVYKGVDENQDQQGKCFEPRHGLRATRDGKTVDLVICFVCVQLRAYGAGVDGKTVLISQSPRDLLTKTLKDAGVPLPPRN
jgi:hypothetical protein